MTEDRNTNDPSWGATDVPIPIDTLITESDRDAREPIPLGDRLSGARQQQSALERRIDSLKSRAEINRTAQFRSMLVQKAVARNANPTMLSLFRIDVINQAVLNEEQAETFLNGVEGLLEAQESELTAWETGLDKHIRERLTPETLKANPMSYSNTLPIRMTITCQQSMRLLHMLEQLDRIAVKSTVLEIHGVTMPSVSKRELRKIIGNMVKTMRSLIDLERKATRLINSNRQQARDMQQVADSMGFTNESPQLPAEETEAPGASQVSTRRQQDEALRAQTLHSNGEAGTPPAETAEVGTEETAVRATGFID